MVYTYDVDDRWIGREIDSNGDGTPEVIERYGYVGSDVSVVFDGSNQTLERMLRHPNEDAVLGVDRGGGDVRWLLGDHQNSVRRIVSGTGATTLTTADYDPYGNLASGSIQRFGYTGQECDAETGLSYYGALQADYPRQGSNIVTNCPENSTSRASSDAKSDANPPVSVADEESGSGVNLQAVITAWPTLTASTRATILDLIRASGQSKPAS